MTIFSINRIKIIIQQDKEIGKVSKDATLAISVALEQFIADIGRSIVLHSETKTLKAQSSAKDSKSSVEYVNEKNNLNKQKKLGVDNFKQCIAHIPRFDFLRGVTIKNVKHIAAPRRKRQKVSKTSNNRLTSVQKSALAIAAVSSSSSTTVPFSLDGFEEEDNNYY